MYISGYIGLERSKIHLVLLYIFSISIFVTLMEMKEIYCLCALIEIATTPCSLTPSMIINELLKIDINTCVHIRIKIKLLVK